MWLSISTGDSSAQYALCTLIQRKTEITIAGTNPNPMFPDIGHTSCGGGLRPGRHIIIIIIMEKTEAGLRGLCIREIDVKSQGCGSSSDDMAVVRRWATPWKCTRVQVDLIIVPSSVPASRCLLLRSILAVLFRHFAFNFVEFQPCASS